MTLQDDYTKAADCKSDAYMMQQAFANPDNGSQGRKRAQEKGPKIPGFAVACDGLRMTPVVPTGLAKTA